jgi:hypothetical protein
LYHLGLIQLHADEDTNKLNSRSAIYNGQRIKVWGGADLEKLLPNIQVNIKKL